MSIIIRNFSKSFGKLEAVSDLSLEVAPGEIFAFLGPNGAGKTTTIRTLAGILPPSAGELRVAGYNIRKNPREAKAATGFIPDTPFLFDRLTGRELLLFAGRLFGMDGAEARREGQRWLDYFDLGEWADRLIESYSHGRARL